MRKQPAIMGLITLLIIITSLNLQAQFYSAGQDPASVRWQQIRTDNFQVIFPLGYHQQAQYISNVLEWAYENVSENLDHRPRKISVIIHNQTIVSNGFVSWAPRRMELYTTPPADNEHHDWMEGLVIHEFRHVVQIDKLNQGITKILGILFGEMGTGAIAGRIPTWFLEGDAVATETEFTRAGRGRLPRFEQGLRAQILTRGAYSFDKAFMGSYKDYVPNHYELGYQLVASARAQYGAEVWAPVIDRVARRPFTLYPFSTGIKKQTGQRLVNYYRSTMNMLDSAWREQREQYSYTRAENVSPDNKLYTSYTYPGFINDSTIIALKSGLRDIPSFVMLDDKGDEKHLFYPGPLLANSVDAAAGRIVWASYDPDPRWAHRSYGNIWLYDFNTGSRTRITTKGKFFSPALSPDGNLIAAIEITPENNNALVIIDATTSNETWRFSLPGNELIMQPAWHSSAKKLATVVLDENGKRLEEVDIDDKSSQTLFIAVDADISSPVYLGDDILINATWSGIDNIYRVSSHGETVLAISSEFGAVNADASGTNIIYSDYSSDGYRIRMTDAGEMHSLPLDEINNHSPSLFRKYTSQQTRIAAASIVPKEEFEVKSYSRLANLFHLHSWFPAHLDVTNVDFTPGISLLFQNKLSTSFAQVGYQWDMNEQTGKYSASYTYRGWYPVTDFLAETGTRRLFYTAAGEERNFIFTENRYRIALSVPQSYISNELLLGFTPSINLGITQATPHRNTPDSIIAAPNRYLRFGESTYYSQEYRLFTYIQRRSVARDIYPRYGQLLDINYRHTPFGKYDMGNTFSARGITYLPGLIRHHGIRVTAGYQKRNPGENERTPGIYRMFYNYGTLIPYPRGIIGQSHQRLVSATTDYAFPVLYPDLAIPSIIYIKRIRANVFYDYATALRFPENNENEGKKDIFTSPGFGIQADSQIFRLPATVVLGFQISFPQYESPWFQFLYNISF